MKSVFATSLVCCFASLFGLLALSAMSVVPGAEMWRWGMHARGCSPYDFVAGSSCLGASEIEGIRHRCHAALMARQDNRNRGHPLRSSGAPVFVRLT